MRLLSFVRSASREANLLAAAASVALLIKVLVLNRFPEGFLGAYQLGLLMEAILASVVASYLFYLLVVHSKESSDRAILRPYVEKHSTRVVGDCISQLSAISEASGMSLDLTTISKSEIVSAFSKIAPYSKAPLLVSLQPDQYANWFEYFSHYENRTKQSIRKLFDQLPFLDAKLVSILTAIDDCSHFFTLSIIHKVRIGAANLANRAESFYEYCSICRQLNSHLVTLGFSPATPHGCAKAVDP